MNKNTEIKAILETNEHNINKMLTIKHLNITGNTQEAILIECICKEVFNAYDFISIIKDLVDNRSLNIANILILASYLKTNK